MSTYPQLSSGALTQYPIPKRQVTRTIVNLSEDGHVYVLADANAAQVEWELNYAGLSDVEAQLLLNFFDSCEGPLQSFTFVDPCANLLNYSEDFTQPAWQSSSLLQFTTGIDDPFGTNRATRFMNISGAALQLTQTVSIPGSLTTAFSSYLRGSVTGGLELQRTDGSNVATGTVAPAASWSRFYVSSEFAASVSPQCSYAIVIPAGAMVDVFGPQVDAQPLPGLYLTSSGNSSIYTSARFGSDQILIRNTAPGLNSLNLTVITRANSNA